MKRSKHVITFLSDALEFPSVENANPDGLLAMGGDLSVARLLLAYQKGIFPWFSEDSLILWWSPDPRMVLYPQKVKVSKSMGRILQKNTFTLTKNKAFNEVLEACAQIKRKGQSGTWITPAMKSAYTELHKKGHASSYEVWVDERLVGGLYGVDLGHVFCGESMFSLHDNASKFALIKLCEDVLRKKYELIDCQTYTPHLARMGAEEIPRKEFVKILERNNPGGK